MKLFSIAFFALLALTAGATAADSSGGQGAGKVSMSGDLKTSTTPEPGKLFLACATGQHIPAGSRTCVSDAPAKTATLPAPKTK